MDLEHGSRTTNEELNDIIKIVQAHQGANILLKRITKTIENKTK